jgi:hypothetical protein
VLKRSFIVAVIDKREMRHYLFFCIKKDCIHKNKYLHLCKCVTKYFCSYIDGSDLYAIIFRLTPRKKRITS